MRHADKALVIGGVLAARAALTNNKKLFILTSRCVAAYLQIARMFSTSAWHHWPRFQARSIFTVVVASKFMASLVDNNEEGQIYKGVWADHTIRTAISRMSKWDNNVSWHDRGICGRTESALDHELGLIIINVQRLRFTVTTDQTCVEQHFMEPEDDDRDTDTIGGSQCDSEDDHAIDTADDDDDDVDDDDSYWLWPVWVLGVFCGANIGGERISIIT